MKILIWLLCFFVVSVIQTAAHEAGVILGAIPAMLLFGLAWWSAKKLCALWDQRQAEKAALAVSESPIPAPLPAEQEPTIADPSAPAPATPKLRFCKHCGSPIDPATRQCSGCGKQYFRPPVLRKKHLAVAAGVLACSLVLVLIFNLTAQLNTANSQIAELNSRIQDLNAQIVQSEEAASVQRRIINNYKSKEASYLSQLSEKDETIKTLQETAQELIPENYFFRQYAVIVGDDGTKIYHKYGCSYLDTSDGLWIFNIENAKYQGYKACSHCCN